MNAISKPPSRSKLKAVAPKAAIPAKPKILVYGKPGVGKTWASLDFPSVYYIDAENGANLSHYTDKLAASGGVYMGQDQGAADFDVVCDEVKALATEKHHFRTLVIDSVSHLFNTAILHEQKRLGDKDAYGASKKPAVQKIRDMLDWTQKLDMNVIFIAQEKEVWGANGKEGVTFDADPKMEYLLHLVLNVKVAGGSRKAVIGKSRLETFPTGSVFDWSYDSFAEKYGRAILEAESQPLVLATEEQVAEVVRLLETVKVSEDFAEKCFKRASVDNWSDMDTDKIAQVIESLRLKLKGE